MPERLQAWAWLPLLLIASGLHAAEPSHEQILEQRVRTLEDRVQQLERLLTAAAPPKTEAQPTANSPGPNLSEAPQAIGTAKPDEPPQETFVFRENTVTLKPRKLEAFADFGYVRASGSLQGDRAFTSAAAVRLGVTDWLELGTVLPAYVATRTLAIGPFRSHSREIQGLGDLSVQANARLAEQTTEFPGIVLSVGGIAPTGVGPYDFARYQPDPTRAAYNPNPSDFTGNYLSRGIWGQTANLQFYKTLDPVIVFFGAGEQYFLTDTVQGHKVQPGMTYLYNLGFSLALSEKSTLGFQINGSYAAKLHVDGNRVPESNVEPIVARTSFIQRIYHNTYIEPGFTAGLTRDAPDFGVDLGLRHRF